MFFRSSTKTLWISTPNVDVDFKDSAENVDLLSTMVALMNATFSQLLLEVVLLVLVLEVLVLILGQVCLCIQYLVQSGNYQQGCTGGTEESHHGGIVEKHQRT